MIDHVFPSALTSSTNATFMDLQEERESSKVSNVIARHLQETKNYSCPP